MDFDLPADIVAKLRELDEFIEREIKPLEAKNLQYFDHRREYARTNWEKDGQPRDEWNDLIAQMERLADKAGHLRYGLPVECGGQAASPLAIAVIREHLAAKGLELHNDLQDESSVVGNFPLVPILHAYGSAEQKQYIEGIIGRKNHLAFALTEPGHGSDATWLETTGRRDGDYWVINGQKRYNSQVYRAKAPTWFSRARRAERVDAQGITAFIVRACATPASGDSIQPLDVQHAERPPGGRLQGCARAEQCDPARRGRGIAGGATIRAREPHSTSRRQRRGGPLLHRRGREVRQFAQGIWNDAVETAGGAISIGGAACRMRAGAQLSFSSTAWKMWISVDPLKISDQVSICNFRANRLVCEAADRAMQVYGGLGYTRALPFEHIYRHHRRYRITEGSEEIQIRRVAQYLFRFGSAGS